MDDYLHHHPFFSSYSSSLEELGVGAFLFPSFHHMQKHMALRKLAPLLDTFFATSQKPRFPNHNGRGHGTQVLHVVKDGDDAPISLLW